MLDSKVQKAKTPKWRNIWLNRIKNKFIVAKSSYQLNSGVKSPIGVLGRLERNRMLRLGLF